MKFQLDLPMVFQVISSEEKTIDSIYKNIIDISENRFVEKYSEDEFEICIIVNRIKLLFHYVFSCIYTILFLMNIVKQLVTNFKLLEMPQIMGASSIELAKNFCA